MPLWNAPLHRTNPSCCSKGTAATEKTQSSARQCPALPTGPSRVRCPAAPSVLGGRHHLTNALADLSLGALQRVVD